MDRDPDNVRNNRLRRSDTSYATIGLGLVAALILLFVFLGWASDTPETVTETRPAPPTLNQPATPSTDPAAPLTQPVPAEPGTSATGTAD